MILLCAVSGGAFAWAIYNPRPYGAAVGVQAVLPPVAALAMYGRRRLDGFDGRKSPGKPDLGYALLLPVLALAIRASQDWNLLDLGRFWRALAGVTAALLILVLACGTGLRTKATSALLILLLCLCYSYGLLVHINCFYDDSWPVTYETRVIARYRDASGKGPTTYHLRVKPWLGQPMEHQVQVPWPVYDRHPVGGSVTVVVHSGLLGFPWYAAF